MKKTITESQLNAIISESIKRVLNEARGLAKQKKYNNITIKDGYICFNGENGYYMKEDRNGEYDVYDDGEWEGKYCGSLQYLESLPSGSAALTYVLRGL